MNRILIMLFLCAFFACGCSTKQKSNGYQIGIDPSWYPLEVAGQEKNIQAFSMELLSQIAKKERLQLSVMTMNWDNLVQGLQTEKYHAILSPMPTYNFYLKTFSFSQPYLKTGPVIIVSVDSKIKGTNDLRGKEIGVVKDSSGERLLQSAPGVILRTYDSIAYALIDLADKHIEGVISDLLIAQNYVRNFYSGVLKIGTDPLNDDGLRLITLHGKAPDLIKRFNRALEHFKASGDYDKLLKKWGLSPDSKPVAVLDDDIRMMMN